MRDLEMTPYFGKLTRAHEREKLRKATTGFAQRRPKADLSIKVLPYYMPRGLAVNVKLTNLDSGERYAHMAMWVSNRFRVKPEFTVLAAEGDDYLLTMTAYKIMVTEGGRSYNLSKQHGQCTFVFKFW